MYVCYYKIIHMNNSEYVIDTKHLCIWCTVVFYCVLVLGFFLLNV